MSVHVGGRGPFHLTRVASGAGPSPPPVYTTGAVSLDGGTALVNSSPTITDGTVILFSIWLFCVVIDGTFYPILFQVDPAGTYTTGLQGGFDPDATGFALDCENVDDSDRFKNVASLAFSTGVWMNVLGKADTNHSAGNKISQLYLTDIDASGALTDAGSAFTMVFNALPFFIGTDGLSWIKGYFSDYWWASGQDLDLSVTANRRKFISASSKPVDLGSDGSTPTGTAPDIFLRIASGGNPLDYRTNKGTAGNFTQIGEATTTGALVSGSADVIVADTTGITAGVRVYATGVTNGTTVLSVDTGLSTVTMSATATGTNPTADMQFGGVLQLAPSSPSD